MKGCLENTETKVSVENLVSLGCPLMDTWETIESQKVFKIGEFEVAY